MSLFDHVAEQKLAQAIAAGELDHLPGSGRPLELEDLARVDEELRAGYLLLKNAGVLPEEMELAKELLRLGDLVRACEDPEERASLEGRRRALALRHALLMERGGSR
jgi:hypothetical protein